MFTLLCSVDAEAELILERMQNRQTTVLGSKNIVEGTLAGRRAALCIGGMGKVNAGHAATLLLTRYGAQALFIFGIGGAYPSSGARIGDIVLAKEEIAGDEGVLTASGFEDTRSIGIPLLKTASTVIYNTYTAPEGLLTPSLQLLTSLTDQCRVHVGSFVTLSTCTGTARRANELEARYHGLCENMEGAAAAQVAELHGVPWLEVRGISNIVQDRDLATWDIPKAAAAAQNALLRIMEGRGQ